MEREPTTWIKLDRNILDWRWFTDGNTFRVFVYLLLTANIEDKDFLNGVIHRGETATSIGQIAGSLGITYKQARTALEHLKETGEVAITRKPKHIVISILKYDAYQGEGNQKAIKGQSKGNQRAITKEYKNIRIKDTLSLSLSHKPYHIPSLDEVREYERTSEQGKDPEEFFKHYSAEGWKANGKKIYSWQKLYDQWQPPEKVIKIMPNHPKYTDEDGYVYEWDEDKGRYEVISRPKRSKKHETDEG